MGSNIMVTTNVHQGQMKKGMMINLLQVLNNTQIPQDQNKETASGIFILILDSSNWVFGQAVHGNLIHVD